MCVHPDVRHLFPQTAARREEIKHHGVKYQRVHTLEITQLEVHVVVLVHGVHATIVPSEELVCLSFISGGASDLQALVPV